MTDLFGHVPAKPPFVDIRNQRPTVAQEKAQLCLRIGEMTRKPPPKVVNGSVQFARQWLHAAKAARKAAGKKGVTVPELTAAISNLERFER